MSSTAGPAGLGYSPVGKINRRGQLLSTHVLPGQLVQRDNNIRPERLLRPHLRRSINRAGIQWQQAAACRAAAARRPPESVPLLRRARTDDSGVSSIGEESK